MSSIRIVWFLINLAVIISCSFLRTLPSSINKLPRGGRFSPQEVTQRQYFFAHRQNFRFKIIAIIYLLGITNGIIFDSLLTCPLGALLVLNFIALINDELTGVLFNLVTRVLCPNINVKIAFGILYDSRNIINMLFIHVLISLMVMVCLMMKVYYYK